MYRELGFIRVWGSQASARSGGVEYAYLIYPHQPDRCLCAADRAADRRILRRVPDDTRPYGSSRLPDSDDVLAKWMALTGDERRLLATANMHMPGRQVDSRPGDA